MAWVAGCAAPAKLVHTPAEIWAHVISVDGQGVPHDPTVANGRALSMDEFRGQVKGILESMGRFHDAHPGRKLLIFAHGGLTPPAHGLASADAEISGVEAAGYYPIFLDWNSDIVEAYGEHLTGVTQGETDRSLMRRLLSPLYLLADAGRAVTRAPVVWANEIGTDLSAAGADVGAMGRGEKETSTLEGSAATPGPMSAPTTRPMTRLANLGKQRWSALRNGREAAEAYASLRAAQAEDPAQGQMAVESTRPRTAVRAYIGPDLDLDVGHLAKLGAAYLVTSPTKFGLSWLVDGAGSPAWQNMSRRTLMAFDGQMGGNPGNPGAGAEVDLKERSRDERAQNAKNFKTTGAFAVFRHELLNVIGDRGRGMATTHPADPARLYHITLVGHSMGSMVMNEWIRRDLAENRPPFYSNIVYMAAACTVRDFGRSVVPYLAFHGPEAGSLDEARKAGTQFYNLTLHPIADLRERNRAWDVPPRGSLLVWLDDFLTDPQTPLDRTLGRWDNIVSAIELIPREVRGQVSIKAFALAPLDTDTPYDPKHNYGPQSHGQFRGQPYWCPEFWYSEGAEVVVGKCGG